MYLNGPLIYRPKFRVVDLTQQVRILQQAPPTEVYVRIVCSLLCLFSNLDLALWRTYPPNTNYGLLSSHAKAPILDLQWSLSSSLLYSVSADRTLCITDVTTGQRIRKIRAHREIINSLDRTMATASGIELLATGSDDGTVKIWEGGDEAGKQPVTTFDVGCPVTSVCWGLDGNSVYLGAIDNEIHVCISLSQIFLFMQF